MAERKFKAELDFGGHIEPSVQASFEKFHEQLEKIQERAKETTETLKEMGEMAVEFGIALIGIEEAKNVFQWLNESGKDFLDTQIRINDELERLGKLQGKGPEGIARMKEGLEDFNEELRKSSIYSREAIDRIEAGLLQQRGLAGEHLNVEAVKRLVPAALAAWQHAHPTEKLSGEQGDIIGQEIANFILKGGKGSLEALGFDVNKSEIQAWIKEHYGIAKGKGKIGKPDVITPQMAAAFLRAKLGGSEADMQALIAGKERPEAQPLETMRSLEEIATRIGTSLEKAFQPLARMMNIIMGDDPAGKGSALDRFFDLLDEKSKAFDNWVKSSFTPTWQSILGTTTTIAQKINEFFTPTYKADMQASKDAWGFIKNVWDSASTAIATIQGFTKEKLPFLDIGTNLKGIGKDIQESWTQISGILKDLQPVIEALGTGLGRMAGVSFAGLEVAVATIKVAFDVLLDTLKLVKTTIDAITGHPVDISDVLKKSREATLPTDPKVRAVTDRLFAAAQADREAGTHEHMEALKRQLHAESVPGYAEGGIVTEPHVGMVGESGPEAIIPLSEPSGVVEQLFGWMGVQKHAEDTRAKLEKSTEDTQKMQEMFATLPDIAAQVVQQFQAMSQIGPGGGMGLGSGYGGGGGMTEYGASVPGDQPGGPTYDWNSYHGIGAYTQHLVPGQDVAMHPEYAESHYHIRPLDFMSRTRITCAIAGLMSLGVRVFQMRIFIVVPGAEFSLSRLKPSLVRPVRKR